RRVSPVAGLRDERDIGGRAVHALVRSFIAGTPSPRVERWAAVEKPTAERRTALAEGHPPIGEHSIGSPERVTPGGCMRLGIQRAGEDGCEIEVVDCGCAKSGRLVARIVRPRRAG